MGPVYSTSHTNTHKTSVEFKCIHAQTTQSLPNYDRGEGETERERAKEMPAKK